MLHYPAHWLGRSTLLNGLTHYWPLDDARDAVSGSVGSVEGTGTSFASAKNGNGLVGTGTGMLYVGAGPTGAAPRSFAGWVFVTSGSGSFYVGGTDVNGSGTAFGCYYVSSDWLSVWIGGATVYPCRMYKNTWQHFVLTYDGTNIEGYLNAEKGTSQNVGTLNTTADTWGLGGVTPAGACLNGKLDECAMWNRALTQAEVTELYRSGSGKFWPFRG